MAVCVCQRASADDWPSWRGPTRDGHTREASGWTGTGWLSAAPLWTGRVGEGCTSPIVWRGSLFTLGWQGGRDRVVCLDAATGKLRWQQAYACARYGRHHVGDENAYSGPTATPELDVKTGFLYTLGADGDLVCWDTAASGRRVWGLNLYADYAVPRRPEVGKKGSLRDYGYITAPLVHGDWLIVAVGAKKGHLMAFDKKTGRRAWASGSTEPAGHCGGLAPIDVEGMPCLASLTLRQLLIIRLDAGHEGKTLAEHPWVTDFGNNIASPAVHGNHVLITSRYNRSALCKLEVSRRGIRRVWEAPHASGACTPVVHDGRVYWASDSLHCLDFTSGKLLWSAGSYGAPGSCVVTGDGKLIVWGERGKLVLMEPGAKPVELSRRIRIFQTHCWPHLVCAGGRLYVKDRDGNLACFRLSPH